MSGGTYITASRKLVLSAAGARRYASVACRFAYLAVAITTALLAALASGVAIGLWCML